MKARLFLSYSSLVIMVLAGIPFIVIPGGMFLVTTLPAAITAFSPTVTLGSMVTLPPTTTSSSMVEGVRHLLWGYLSLKMLVFGPMKTLLPILHSLEMVTCAWMTQLSPILTSLPMSQKLPMRVSSPIFALSPMIT